MVLLATLALAATAAARASAAAPLSSKPPAFSLFPGGGVAALHLRGIPGDVLSGSVGVRNVSGRPVTVMLQAADIRNSANGNADYATTGLSQTGRWLHLNVASVHLSAHADRQVAFTVSIPAGTTGASHYAGIVAIDAADLATAAVHATPKGTSFSFRRVNRQAVPITIRMPGPLTRSVSLRSVKLIVQPVGASLALGLRPGGTVLIEDATIKLRVLRGARTIFTYNSGLGQLFPGSSLNYSVPWQGRPTTGTYRVVGVLRPRGASAVNIDTTVKLTGANATQLKRVTPPVRGPSSSGLPGWVPIALGLAALLLIALMLTVYKLARRPKPIV